MPRGETHARRLDMFRDKKLAADEPCEPTSVRIMNSVSRHERHFMQVVTDDMRGTQTAAAASLLLSLNLLLTSASMR